MGVEASRDMSTNPHASPYSFSRSMNAMTSDKLACLQGSNRPMLFSVWMRSAGGFPQAISTMTIG